MANEPSEPSNSLLYAVERYMYERYLTPSNILTSRKRAQKDAKRLYANQVPGLFHRETRQIHDYLHYNQLTWEQAIREAPSLARMFQSERDERLRTHVFEKLGAYLSTPPDPYDDFDALEPLEEAL